MGDEALHVLGSQRMYHNCLVREYGNRAWAVPTTSTLHKARKMVQPVAPSLRAYIVEQRREISSQAYDASSRSPAACGVSKNMQERGQADGDYSHGLFDIQTGPMAGVSSLSKYGRFLLVLRECSDPGPFAGFLSGVATEQNRVSFSPALTGAPYRPASALPTGSSPRFARQW